MFDSTANIIFIIVLVVIFIGRTIAQAAKKKQEEPPPIPVHFEDDEEEHFNPRNLAPNNQPVKPAAVPPKMGQYRPLPQSALSPSIAASGGTVPRTAPAGQGAVTGTVPPAQKGFNLNLNHLSAMKQAVVMAEVLGTPKGLV